MDSRFFSFRGHGIMQKPNEGNAPKEQQPVPEHKAGSEDIFVPSDEVIDFSAARTETTDAVHNVVDLEDVKIVDREKEGVLEFDTVGGKKKKSRPKKKRISTIKDYVKTRGDRYETMDYINIDDDHMGVEKASEEKEENAPELDYISIDEEEEKGLDPKKRHVGKAVAYRETPEVNEESETQETFNCPNCGETIVIPSPKRPITLKCPGCRKKGVLRY